MKILTFDIEEWFHILDNPDTQSEASWRQFPSRLQEGVQNILDLLEEYDQKATFFCLGWVTERYPSIIRAIDRAGHHIGTHSFAHQLAYEQSRDQFRDDLKKSLSIIQDTIGKPVDCYRAPGFSITSQNLWAFETLIEEGITIDSSLFPANRAHGGLPNLELAAPTIGNCGDNVVKLFPINTKSLFGRRIIYSGGGYFRLFPNYQIQKWFADDDYVMTYFHPRDFDANQPIVPGLSLLRRFKSYVGISGARNKLAKLLATHQFINLSEAAETVDWDSAPTINLHVEANRR